MGSSAYNRRRRSTETSDGIQVALAKHQRITTPVGLKPTQGDPISLADRRLSHSAKVSSALQNPVELCDWYDHV